MTKLFKPGARETRTFNFDRAATDKKARTVELSFSSEQPYDRSWGKEILDHGSKSVRLGRLRTGGPLLVDHDTRDIVGVIESVRVDADRKGRAVVRFGKSARAEEVFQDVTDGIFICRAQAVASLCSSARWFLFLFLRPLRLAIQVFMSFVLLDIISCTVPATMC